MKKQFLRNCVMSFAFLMFSATGVFAQVETKAIGGIATLYAIDPIAHALCFNDGREGGAFEQNKVVNRCSHIDFNAYNKESLTVGIQGGEIGTIVDLGTPLELQKRYGYLESVGYGQGFASLRAVDDKIFILKVENGQLNEAVRNRTEQELTESALVFAEPTRSNQTAPVKLGHIYITRIINRDDKETKHFVKLLVIGYTPGESVTIRWQAM